MHVLGICGSPRIGGNAETLLDKALEGARTKGAETEKVILNNLNMRPCQECTKVRDDGTCHVEDDFPPLQKKIKSVDGLILASPIFFGSLSAQTKIFIDRFQCYWRYRYILKKVKKAKRIPGGLILVEASARQEFLDNAKSIVKNAFATIGIDYREELFCPGVDEKGAVLKRRDCLQKAVTLGTKLAS